MKIFKYMNIINSKEINESHNRILNNMQKTIDDVNLTSNMVDEQLYINSVDKFYYESEINNIYSLLDNYNKYTTIRPHDFKNISNTLINYNKKYAMKKYIKSTNKLYIDDYIPEDLILEAIIDKEYINVTDTNILNCATQFNIPWVREVSSNNIDPVYTTLYVYLPYSISTNDFVNEIEFDTFPFNSTTVESIQYSTSYDIKYMSDIKELKHNNGCIINQYSLPYSNSKNHIHLNFDTIKAKVIAITLKQDSFIQDGDINKFYLGLKNLKINYNIYNPEPMIFEIEYIPKSLDGDIISSIQVVYNNNDIYDPTIKVYEDGVLLMNSFNKFKTSDKPITFKFIYNNSTPPNINKIIINN